VTRETSQLPILLVLLLLGAPAGPGLLAGEPPQTITAGVGEIQIRQVGATRVAYLEHQGPYWALGGVFRQVAELMEQTDQPGPMYARYLDDPARTDMARLRAEAGFIVRGELEAPEPFQTRQLPPRTVASLHIEGHCGRAPGFHGELSAWVRQQGYRTDGIVTEIYPIDRESPSGKPITELQLTVEGAAPLAEPDDPDHRPQAAPQPRSDAQRFAERLIPERGLLGPGPQRWLGQVVLRIDAIRTAAAAGPDPSEALDAFAGPILERARKQGHLRDFPAESPPLPDSPDGSGSPAAADLLNRLDGLLVDLTRQRMSPRQAAAALRALTAPLPELVDAWVRPRDPHPLPAQEPARPPRLDAGAFRQEHDPQHRHRAK